MDVLIHFILEYMPEWQEHWIGSNPVLDQVNHQMYVDLHNGLVMVTVMMRITMQNVDGMGEIVVVGMLLPIIAGR